MAEDIRRLSQSQGGSAYSGYYCCKNLLTGRDDKPKVNTKNKNLLIKIDDLKFIYY